MPAAWCEGSHMHAVANLFGMEFIVVVFDMGHV